MKPLPPAVYAAIDLKSFYASVECVERGLDPLTALLVVADAQRTEKTICLAVSPALKQYGLSGRCRLFEVMEKAREIRQRTGRELQYITAPPRMKLYMDYSARIYEKVYLKYVSPDDLHVYSIDEVMIDLTRYLDMYGLPAHELVRRMIGDILKETGITATAGIGTNLYLAKVAMDIVAKHVDADADGVRIAELDELRYRELLWEHRPLTSFWRVGRGIAARLEKTGIFTMGDLARRSLTQEDALYREFGVDAELLIDHAWGLESCTMADIKAYHPETASISAGQVLSCPYPAEKGRLIVHEMADQLVLDLVSKGLVTDSVTLTVIYDRENLQKSGWNGPSQLDWYGRRMPKAAHGTQPVDDSGGTRQFSSSTRRITGAVLALYDRIVDPRLTVRRFYVVLNNTLPRREAGQSIRQLDLFTAPEALAQEAEAEKKEAQLQHAMLHIKDKFGKNAILRGMNFEEGATARERNAQIGGHAAGEEL